MWGRGGRGGGSGEAAAEVMDLMAGRDLFAYVKRHRVVERSIEEELLRGKGGGHVGLEEGIVTGGGGE